MRKTNALKAGASRYISDRDRLRLWVKNAGLCAFKGCSADLILESTTQLPDQLANIAHIVGLKKGSGRFEDVLPQERRNDIDNLMLVCMPHHSHFDKEHEARYPADLLRGWKKEHEQRIAELRKITPSSSTKIISFRARISSETPVLTEQDIRSAILPMFPSDPDGIYIDLTSVPESASENYWLTCMEAIKSKITSLHDQPATGKGVHHVSVFAMAPIPLLMHLGRALGNKLPASFYQRHRDTQSWSWKTDSAEAVNYKTELLRAGTSGKSAILLLSLSGTISLEQIPRQIENDSDIYQITLAQGSPNVEFLKTQEDLERFRIHFQKFLADIRHRHPELEEIHCLPAVPISVALTCGRELLEKAHPGLLVYDFNKLHSTFTFALRVN